LLLWVLLVAVKQLLLNVFGMIENITSGSYLFFGQDVTKLSEKTKKLVSEKEILGLYFKILTLLRS